MITFHNYFENFLYFILHKNLSLILQFIAIVIVSLIAPISLYIVTKKRENYQHLLDRINSYSSPEMLMAIQRLWDFYNQCEDKKVKIEDQYMSQIKNEEKQFIKSKNNNKLDLERSTIHYQRRLVSYFWRTLSDLIRNDYVPRELVYKWWTSKDIEIVEKILLPIEDKLAESLNYPKIDEEKNSLYYLTTIKNKFLH